MPNLSRIALVMALSCSLAALVGCGSGSSTSSVGTSRATVVLTNDSGGARATEDRASVVTRGDSGSPVPVEDIASLKLVVTEVVLQRCDGDDDLDDGLEIIIVRNFEFDPTTVVVEEGDLVRWVWEEDGAHTVTGGSVGDIDDVMPFNGSGTTEGDIFEAIFSETGFFPYFSNNETDIGEGMAGVVDVVGDSDRSTRGVPDEDDSGHVVIFEGAFELELTDLAALSEVLSAEVIPAGRYCKIRIRVEDPELLFVSDPPEMAPRTNVKLTANGRLFIKATFDLEVDGEYLILLDFGGIHLVDAGSSGMFVLTPQLRATIDVLGVETSFEGEIVSVDCEAGILLVETDESDVFEVVLFESTVIEDSDETALVCEDLEVGQRVEVVGLLTPGGVVEAIEVVVELEELI